MGIADFQRALADMTLDAHLAAAVRSRGASALEGYELTARERSRLEAVSRQPGMSLGCTLARANRFAGIHDVFPMTCVLLAPQLRKLLDELWSSRRPSNYQLAGEETAFAELLEEKLARGELGLEYLEEIFRYEKACWELALEYRQRGAAAAGGVGRSITFRHDPARLLDTLGRFEAPPAGLPTGCYEARVRLIGDELQIEWAESGN